MLFSVPAFLALALASSNLVSAACIGRNVSPSATLPLSEVAASNTGSLALPTPSSAPKYIALGLGYQNYTCSASASSPNGTYVQTQTSTGAVANLYNIEPELTSSNVDTLTPQALKSFEQCLSTSRCSADSPSLEENSFTGDCDACHTVAVLSTVPAAVSQKIGLHFFDWSPVSDSQSPHFAINAFSNYLAAKRVGDVKAPANAYAGASNEGAVDWLYLDAIPGDDYTSGLSGVYRVETAGGAAPKSCTTDDAATIYVPYAAQYWFYD